MGLSEKAVRFLLSGMQLGARVESVCTLGRLNLFATPRRVADLLVEHRLGPADFWATYPSRDAIPMAEPLLRMLGAGRVDSMDHSAYEGATLIHDLNRPIPAQLRDQYDLVLDGGTLEHVFCFTTGLENAMHLVKPGGDLMLVTPANGLCGHGFYQFSPELFFRALSVTYGFELLRLFLSVGGRTYHVTDPAIIRGRVELRRESAELFVHARKVGQFTGFQAMPPQQSDYVASWREHGGVPSLGKADGRLKAYMRKRLSREAVEAISRQLNRWRQRAVVWKWRRQALASNRRLYVPVTRWNVRTREATAPSHS